VAKFTEDDYQLPLDVAGLKLRNPFIVASGPTTKTLEQLIEADRCGWGAASMKLAIEPFPYINLEPRYRWYKDNKYHAFSAEKRQNLDEALRLTEQGRKKTDGLVLLANITYAGDAGLDGWVDMAKRFVEAGAHAIELNMCCPNMSFNVQVSGGQKRTPQTGASFGQNAERVGEAVDVIAGALAVPVFVKLTPEGGRIGEVSRACFAAGAAVVGTTANRLAIPEFDIRRPTAGPFRLQGEPSMACFSGRWIKPLALRDVFEMRTSVGPEPCILGTGGVGTYVDAVQMMMCGADVIGICTETMLRGFEFLPGLVRRMKSFMAEQGYARPSDFRDLAAGAIAPVDRLTRQEGHARVDPDVCDGCGRCVRIGHCYAITMADGKAVVTPGDCTGCSTCLDICPAGAISFADPVRP